MGDEAVAVKGLGDAYLRLLNPPTFRWQMRHQGVADLSKIAELDAYLVLLRRTDSDCAFLRSCVFPARSRVHGRTGHGGRVATRVRRWAAHRFGSSA